MNICSFQGFTTLCVFADLILPFLVNFLLQSVLWPTDMRGERSKDKTQIYFAKCYGLNICVLAKCVC